MMKNGDMPAMPMGKSATGSYWQKSDLDDGYANQCRPAFGLTKREMFAMAAMQGLLSDPNMTLTSAINVAVEAADLLLRRLDGEDINPPIIPNPDWPEEDE